MKQIEIIQTIKSKDEFVKFVNDMSQNYRKDPTSWPNNDIGTYLEALAAWVSDMDGYYKNLNQAVPEDIDWKTIAIMIAAAKYYE